VKDFNYLVSNLSSDCQATYKVRCRLLRLLVVMHRYQIFASVSAIAGDIRMVLVMD